MKLTISIDLPEGAWLSAIYHRSWNEAWTVVLSSEKWNGNVYGFGTDWDIEKAAAAAAAMFEERKAADSRGDYRLPARELRAESETVYDTGKLSDLF